MARGTPLPRLAAVTVKAAHAGTHVCRADLEGAVGGDVCQRGTADDWSHLNSEGYAGLAIFIQEIGETRPLGHVYVEMSVGTGLKGRRACEGARCPLVRSRLVCTALKAVGTETDSVPSTKRSTGTFIGYASLIILYLLCVAPRAG